MNRWQQRSHWAVLGSWGSVAACVWIDALRGGITVSAIGWAAFFSLPLGICLPGLARGVRYTHKWATLCVLPYWVVGLTEAVANTAQRPWALTLLGCALLWFFALISYLRLTAATVPPAAS